MSNGDNLDGWRNSKGNRRGWYWLAAKAVPPALAAAGREQTFAARPRARCEALTRATGERCGRVALAGQRMCMVHAPNVYAQRKPAAPRKASKPAPAPAAPRELREHPAWRACPGQRERNALTHAWHAGDPVAWRRAVARVMRTGEEEEEQDAP